jgi:hypothetical protein
MHKEIESMRHIPLFLTLCLIALPAQANRPCRAEARFEYLLKVQHPPHFIPTEPWAAYYQGNIVPFRGNLATITQAHMRFTFSLIITPSLYHFACPVITNMPILARKVGAPIKWFDLALVMKEGGIWSWEITELEEKDMPIRLPDHSLVFAFDPQYVTLRPPRHTKYLKDTTCVGGSTCIEIPTIVINGETEAVLQKASLTAQVGTIDIRRIHEKLPCNHRIMRDDCYCTLVN